MFLVLTKRKIVDSGDKIAFNLKICFPSPFFCGRKVTSIVFPSKIINITIFFLNISIFSKSQDLLNFKKNIQILVSRPIMENILLDVPEIYCSVTCTSMKCKQIISLSAQNVKQRIKGPMDCFCNGKNDKGF